MHNADSREQGASPEVAGYYQGGLEAARLDSPQGKLEHLRTQEIIRRFLPAPPGIVMDVGGGPGVYAFWLASEGYEVHLVDLAEVHIREAMMRSGSAGTAPLASASVGDARRLNRPDESVDAVLLMGPLYHLTAREERLTALEEARRVLRPGGLAFAVAISRYASVLDGLLHGFLEDPDFAAIVERDLREGQHRNPTGKTCYFTTAFFHLPEEIEQEVRDAGMMPVGTLGIEGPAWLLPDLAARWSDPERRGSILRVARALESQPAILGASAHIMVIGRKEQETEP